MQLRPDLKAAEVNTGTAAVVNSPWTSPSTVITALEFPVCGGLENFHSLLKGILSYAVSIFKQAVCVLRLS